MWQKPSFFILLYSFSNSKRLVTKFVMNSLTFINEENPGKFKKSMNPQTFSRHLWASVG